MTALAIKQSDLLPILGYTEALLGCQDCALREGCRNPVPYSGPSKAQILFLGEGPGENEDITLRPFSGRAGQEFDGLLWNAHIDRDLVRVSNTVRCRPPGNRTPKPPEVASCWQWTVAEIIECDPALIVVMGGTAIRAFFPKATVDEVHGRALLWESPWGQSYWVFCTYHPAAGMHNGRVLSDIQNDFRNLHNYLEGTLTRPVDEYPHPHYRTLDRESHVMGLADEILSAGEVAADTEWTPDEKIWCGTFCINPGEAYLVPPQHLHLLAPALNSERVITTLHQAQADLTPLRQAGIVIRPTNLGDTMIGAYVLNLPQGLKTLARELKGMEMRDYMEVVGPYQRALEDWYLQLALGVDVPLLEKGSRKRTVHQKIQRAINDREKGLDVNPKSRWDEWESWETAPIVTALGPYPQASLADVPYDDAEWYSCRDADATKRVSLELISRMKKWSSFVV